MNLVVLNIALAAVPSVGVVALFCRRNRERRYPCAEVLRAFAMGFFAVIPALAAEVLLSEVPGERTAVWFLLFRAFVIAALVEEATKLAVARSLLRRRHVRAGRCMAHERTSHPSTTVSWAVVVTITAGLGFAFFENILYGLGPPMVLVIRGISAVPLHAGASGTVGYHLGVSVVEGRRSVLRGLLCATLVHGTYNYLLFLSGPVSLLALAVAGFALWIVFRLYAAANDRDKAAGRADPPIRS